MKTITYENQPYGYQIIEVDFVEPVTATDDDHPCIRARAEQGWVIVSGTILEGGTRARLFNATAYRDEAGQKTSITMPREAFEAGRYVTVAM